MLSRPSCQNCIKENFEVLSGKQIILSNFASGLGESPCPRHIGIRSVMLDL